VPPTSIDALTEAQLDTLLALDAVTQGGVNGSVRHWLISEARAAGATLPWEESQRLERSTAAVLGTLDHMGLVIASYWKHTVAPYEHFTQWELSYAGCALLGGAAPPAE
jgi:hypothetical protein